MIICHQNNMSYNHDHILEQYIIRKIEYQSNMVYLQIEIQICRYRLKIVYLFTYLFIQVYISYHHIQYNMSCDNHPSISKMYSRTIYHRINIIYESNISQNDDRILEQYGMPAYIITQISIENSMPIYIPIYIQIYRRKRVEHLYKTL